MTRKDGPAEPAPYPARKARGGDIVLRTTKERAIFIGGLAGALVLAIILAVVAAHA